MLTADAESITMHLTFPCVLPLLPSPHPHNKKNQIRYMVFFTYFFAEKVFIYIFLILSCLSLVYLLYKPRDTPASAVEMKAVLARNSRPTSRL